MYKSFLLLALMCVLSISSCSSSKKADGDVSAGANSSFVVSSITITNTVETQYDGYTSYTNNLSEKTITATQQWNDGYTGSQTYELDDKGQPIALIRTIASGESVEPIFNEVYSYNDQGLLAEAIHYRNEQIVSRAVYTWSDDGRLELEAEEDVGGIGVVRSLREVDYQYNEEGQLMHVLSTHGYTDSDEAVYTDREDYNYNTTDNSVEVLNYVLPAETLDFRRIEYRDENGNLVKLERYDTDGGLQSTIVIRYERVDGLAFNEVDFARQCVVNLVDGC